MTKIELIFGDCIWALPHLPSKSADYFLFDPPFCPKSKAYKQIRIRNKHFLEPIPTPQRYEYKAWWRRICHEARRILKPTGWFMFKSDDWTSKFIFETTCEYFDYYSERIWDKVALGLGKFIRKQHEHIEVYRPYNATKSYLKRSPRLNKLKSASHGGTKGIAIRSVIRLQGLNKGAFGQSRNDHDHINQTPNELWFDHIDNFCPRGGLVVDPNMGSGSIGQQCKKMHRDYIGMEIHPLFYQNAVDKIEKTQSNLLTKYLK